MHNNNLQQETKEYLAYRRDFRKRFGNKGHLSFEEFQHACDLEDEADAKEWQQHIKAMSHSSRYI